MCDKTKFLIETYQEFVFILLAIWVPFFGHFSKSIQDPQRIGKQQKSLCVRKPSFERENIFLWKSFTKGLAGQFGTLFCQPGAFSKVLKPYMHSPPKQKKMGNAQIDGALFINVLILWHLGYVVCPIFSSKLPLFTSIFFLCSEPTQCIVSMLFCDKFSLPVGQKNLYPRARRLYHNTTCWQ